MKIVLTSQVCLLSMKKYEVSRAWKNVNALDNAGWDSQIFSSCRTSLIWASRLNVEKVWPCLKKKRFVIIKQVYLKKNRTWTCDWHVRFKALKMQRPIFSSSELNAKSSVQVSSSGDIAKRTELLISIPLSDYRHKHKREFKHLQLWNYTWNNNSPKEHTDGLDVGCVPGNPI
jgi:hypothetical protein